MALIGISGKLQHGKDLTANLIQFLIFQDRLRKNGQEFATPNIELHASIFRKWSSRDQFIYSGFAVKKYAEKLKQMVALAIGCKREDLESAEFKASYLSEEWNRPVGFWPGDEKRMTVRDMLVIMGTEAMRKQVHPNFWVNALFVDYVERDHLIYGIKVGGITPDGMQVVEIPAEPESEKKHPNWIITDVRFPNELEPIEEKGGFMIRVVNTSKPVAQNEHESETALDNHNFKYRIINKGHNYTHLLDQLKPILQAEGII